MTVSCLDDWARQVQLVSDQPSRTGATFSCTFAGLLTSKPVTPETVNRADLIVGVQRSHVAHLLEDYPSAKRKLRFLDNEVRDLYCGPIDEYRSVRDELRTLLSRLISSLESDRG